jgi:preprotein translocase subunit SecY
MISAFANTWRVPELPDRILFTLAMIVIVRLGVAVTIPGVDATVIKEWLDLRVKEQGSNPAAAVGALLTVFSGGGLQQCGLFALGIMPYISASIMVQLMTAVVPKLARMAREDGGRQKINQYTRYLTIGIALIQGIMLAQSLKHPEQIFYLSGIEKVGRPLVSDPNFQWMILTVLTIVSATMLLMWIGDQITERGIGNGTSLIITVNIISALPGALVQAWNSYVTNAKESPFNALILVLLIAFLLFVVAAVIAITQGQRRIAIQYAKRVVGRKMFGGQTQYLPLKVNYAGVMPIIFASAVLALPAMLIQWIFRGSEWATRLQYALTSGVWYFVLAGLMIFFFSYFWVATMFQPSQISEDLKRNGGYIPGVRPGKPTAEFLDFTMSRLTFAGAIFLTIIFVLPGLIQKGLSLPALVTQFFGGTSLLILVGVLLDVMRQVETHLLQRHYDGFLRKGRVKGRYDRLQQTGRTATSTTLVYLWAFIAALVVVGIAAWIYN